MQILYILFAFLSVHLALISTFDEPKPTKIHP